MPSERNLVRWLHSSVLLIISLFQSVAFLPKQRFANVCRANHFQQTKFCTAEDCLTNLGDDFLTNELKNIELLSPSKKTNQKVGCLILSGNVVLIRATNSFLRHVGVHAEMNALAQYLSTFPPPLGSLHVAVTYSPCVECAQLICMINEIRHVCYRFEYNDGGLPHLNESGIDTKELRVDETELRPKSLKLHSYNKLVWEPNVTGILLTRNLDGISVLSHTGICAFDIRPFVISALRNRNSNKELLHLDYSGNLNHRESLFLEVMGVSSCSVPAENLRHSTAIIIESNDAA